MARCLRSRSTYGESPHFVCHPVPLTSASRRRDRRGALGVRRRPSLVRRWRRPGRARRRGADVAHGLPEHPRHRHQRGGGQSVRARRDLLPESDVRSLQQKLPRGDVRPGHLEVRREQGHLRGEVRREHERRHRGAFGRRRLRHHRSVELRSNVQPRRELHPDHRRHILPGRAVVQLRVCHHQRGWPEPVRGRARGPIAPDARPRGMSLVPLSGDSAMRRRPLHSLRRTRQRERRVPGRRIRREPHARDGAMDINHLPSFSGAGVPTDEVHLPRVQGMNAIRPATPSPRAGSA